MPGGRQNAGAGSYPPLAVAVREDPRWPVVDLSALPPEEFAAARDRRTRQPVPWIRARARLLQGSSVTTVDPILATCPGASSLPVQAWLSSASS